MVVAPTCKHGRAERGVFCPKCHAEKRGPIEVHDHDDLEDLIEYMEQERPRLSVPRIHEHSIEVVKRYPKSKRGTCFFFWQHTVTTYNRDTRTIHRWTADIPDERKARNYIAVTCDEARSLPVKAILELHGFNPTQGEWTPELVGFLLGENQ